MERIAGHRSGLAQPAAVAVDASHAIYVLNGYGNHYQGSITVYAPGLFGQHPPERLIEGPHTGLTAPDNLAIDHRGNIYVSNTGSVTVYGPTANGDATPARTIEGADTKLASPDAVALDGHDDLFVVNAAVALCTITEYPPGADGDVAPIRDISGPNTDLESTSGIAIDRSGFIYASDFGFSSQKTAVTVYAPDADGDAAPVRTISGPATRLGQPTRIALDSASNIYVTDRNQGGEVNVYAAGASGDSKPIRYLVGRKTSLSYYTSGIAVR
jgi:sugar lactone lactonase YvrE